MTSTVTVADPPTATDLASPAAEAEADAGRDPGLEESARDIATAVITMMRQFNSIKSRVALGPDGDTSPLFLLVKLSLHGPSRASDLAGQLCADPSTVSRQVASLVKGGLIERRADPDDGRASILVPTELGLAKVAEHTERRGAIMQPVLAEWAQHDRDELLRLITKYTEGIEAHREQIISLMIEHHGSGSDGRAPARHLEPEADVNKKLWKENH